MCRIIGNEAAMQILQTSIIKIEHFLCKRGYNSDAVDNEKKNNEKGLYLTELIGALKAIR